MLTNEEIEHGENHESPVYNETILVKHNSSVSVVDTGEPLNNGTTEEREKRTVRILVHRKYKGSRFRKNRNPVAGKRSANWTNSNMHRTVFAFARDAQPLIPGFCQRR